MKQQEPDPKDLVHRAKAYATSAHQRIGHLRKYTKLPYAVHLENVARLVATVTDDPEMVAAAWLHDVVEDTPATLQNVEAEFGRSVAELVDALTDVSKPGDGNRAVRKEIDRMHIAQASPRAKTVKLADLIDNCRDICKNDPGFARVYVNEFGALLEVLNDGNPTLYNLAAKTYRESAAQLGLSHEVTVPIDERPHPLAVPPRLIRLFTESFTARDVAEPMRSFDVEQPSAHVRSILDQHGIDVAVLRQNGMNRGYVFAPDLVQGSCGDFLRPFQPREVLADDSPLSDVIHILTLHSHAFVSVLGEVTGCIRRSDVSKPVFRMWLFGIVTLTEMELTRLISEHFPDESWRAYLTPGRLEKAIHFQEERERRGQHTPLLECLQLADKAEILLEQPEVLKSFGFESKRTAKRAIKELQSLRNNLAHAQDVHTHDWPQIARFAARLGEAATRI